MKKIYSLLLLGGLLLFGAENAWADDPTYYLKGTFNNWDASKQFTGSPLSCTVSLDAYTKYEFKINDGGDTWWGNGGVITCGVTGWTFKTSDGDCTIHSGSEGDYTFTMTKDGSGQPIVTVTYPAGNTSYTVYFERSDWSGEFTFAYPWSGTAPSETKILGNFPGAKFWGNITFETDEEPEHIIFNDGDWDGHHQTETLPFYNGTTYNQSGIKPFSLTINSYGWASMYLTFPAIVPEGATAYYASNRSGSVITLTAISEGEVIPANTGVVVKGTANASYTFAYNSGSPVSVSNNLLKGVFAATETAVNSTYVLAAGDANSCTFRKYTNAGNDGNVTLGANKAYILVSDVSGAPTIRFEIDDENNATAIENLDANEKTVKFFDNGQLRIVREGVTYDATGRVVR